METPTSDPTVSEVSRGAGPGGVRDRRGSYYEWTSHDCHHENPGVRSKFRLVSGPRFFVFLPSRITPGTCECLRTVIDYVDIVFTNFKEPDETTLSLKINSGTEETSGNLS